MPINGPRGVPLFPSRIRTPESLSHTFGDAGENLIWPRTSERCGDSDSGEWACIGTLGKSGTRCLWLITVGTPWARVLALALTRVRPAGSWARVRPGPWALPLTRVMPGPWALARAHGPGPWGLGPALVHGPRPMALAG